MFNVKEGLWWRDHNFDPPYKEPNGENCYWSRGNGWVYAALVRVMNEIPSDEMSASTIRQTSEAKRLPAQLFSYMVWLGAYATVYWIKRPICL